MISAMQIRDFRLERYFGLYEFSVGHQLSLSDCETCSIGELLDLAGEPQEALMSLRLGYTESQGDPALRDAIARHYEHCTADDVVVTNAPQEAIFLAMHALLKPSSRVVVQTPCYQSLFEVARSIGCTVVPWSIKETEQGWEYDLEGLPALLEGADILVMNAPHNPTGYQPSESERAHIADIAHEAGARIFSDEMYRGLERDPADALPPEAERSDRAVSLWGGSKSFGLAGLRIGWLVCRDRKVVDALIRLKDYTTICNSGPGELLMRTALATSEALLSKNRALIAANDALIQSFADEHAARYKWRPPKAGPVGLLEVRGIGATELCDRLRVEADILLAPSPLFDMADKYVRLGLGRTSFAAGLEQWRSWEIRRQ